jgi:hypothetical protein
MVRFIYILFSLMLFSQITVKATNTEVPTNSSNAVSKTERYIQYLYNKLSFKKMNKVSYVAFKNAAYGYFNLKEAGKIKGNALLTICDFSLSSNKKRLWVIDIQKKKVLFNSLVAHGQGSGEEFATKFSNVHESHQSSLGFYVTGEPYQGDNGYSLKLHGVDGAYNSNAFDRAIVIHGADYVSETFAAANNRIGRSHGCPALPRELNDIIINKIQNGSALFIYHPNKAYIKTSYWLNNKIAKLPAEADFIDMQLTQAAQEKLNKMSMAEDSLVINPITIPTNTKVIKDSIVALPKTTPAKVSTAPNNTNNTNEQHNQKTEKSEKSFLNMNKYSR